MNFLMLAGTDHRVCKFKVFTDMDRHLSVGQEGSPGRGRGRGSGLDSAPICLRDRHVYSTNNEAGAMIDISIIMTVTNGSYPLLLGRVVCI